MHHLGHTGSVTVSVHDAAGNWTDSTTSRRRGIASIPTGPKRQLLKRSSHWKLGWARRPEHLNHKGQPKFSYETRDEARRVVAEMVADGRDGPYDTYWCRYCELFHVGRHKQRQPVTQNDYFELGERAADCMKRENRGTPNQRLATLRKAGLKAEKRARQKTTGQPPHTGQHRRAPNQRTDAASRTWLLPS